MLILNVDMSTLTQASLLIKSNILGFLVTQRVKIYLFILKTLYLKN